MKTILALLYFVLLTFNAKASCLSLVPINPGSPSLYPYLQLWLKSDILTLTNNAPVGETNTVWTDSSSHARHATNATAADRPLYKTNIFGTKPSIRFDGVSDFLSFTPDISLGNNESYTVIVIGKSINNADAYLLGHSTTNIQYRVHRSAGPTVSFFGGSIEAISSAFTVSALNTTVMITWRTDGALDDTFFRENKNDRTSSASGNSFCQLNQIAKTTFATFANWDLGEILVFSRLLTTNEVDSLYDSYMKPRWTELP